MSAQKPVKVGKYKIDTPLDISDAIKGPTNGNKNIYYRILAIFLNNTLERSIGEISNALTSECWIKFKENAHNLKSSSG